MNKHEWIIGEGGIYSCEHGDLPEPADKDYMIPDSKPHAELRRLIFDKKFLKTIPKYEVQVGRNLTVYFYDLNLNISPNAFHVCKLIFVLGWFKREDLHLILKFLGVSLLGFEDTEQIFMRMK